MGSLEKELSVGLRIDFSVKSMVLSRRLAHKPPKINSAIFSVHIIINF